MERVVPPMSMSKSVSGLDDSQLLVVEGGLSKSESGLNELELVVESQNVNDVETGRILSGGTEAEFKNEVEANEFESRVGKFVSELDDSQLFGIECGVSKSESRLNELELVVEWQNVNDVETGRILSGGTEAEFKNEVEANELGSRVGNFVSELDDSQLLGIESRLNELELVVELQNVNDVEADGILSGGTEMELKNEFEANELGSRVGSFLSEVDDSQMLAIEGGISKSDSGINEAELAVVKSPVEDNVVVDESLEGVNGTKLKSEIDAKEIGSKEDEDEEALIKGESGMHDMKMELEAEVTNDGGTTCVKLLDTLHSVDANDDEGAEEEAKAEAPTVDTKMETEAEVGESPEADIEVSAGGKRKRGKVVKVPATPRKKVVGEDVCFICFDGGDMVLCDRRGCPKAYHPSCVNRDEAFFRAKGRWNCGWHLCSHCQKTAYYMCYTCTFSLCKACIKDAPFFQVRTSKGFCETCMKTVMLIENNEHAGKEERVDFDDKSTWEFLFKDYWEDLKANLSLSAYELTDAKNPWKGSDVLAGKQESPEDVFDGKNDQGSGSESPENLVVRKSKRKAKKKLKSLTKEEGSSSSRVDIDAGGISIPNNDWASKELLEFVMHMKNGENSALSQFEVQALLLEYIKGNKLRDPHKKSQIICDTRLQNLFGKARVGHFEMLKLLESHFLVKEDSQPDDVQGSVVDNVVNHLEADGNALKKGSKRKMRRKGDERGPQSNLGEYAAIDIHNISLIYLRRKLVEDLLEDIEKFHDKVLGTFVRIKISGSNQIQDMYRLVQIVGTRKAEPYKVGKKASDLVLEILNLNKKEVISIDTVSNQEFTEDECKRLRQCIKCGLIETLTVGDILDKAMEIKAARVNDWLETEILRLSHLCDRASDLGRKKELRECVEKLQLLKTPEERMRRLEEVPKIHADPRMDPTYESEEEEEEEEEEDMEVEDNKKETMYPRPRGGSGFSRKGGEPISSPHRGNFSPMDSGSSTRTSSGKNWETKRKFSNKDFPKKSEESTLVGQIQNDNAWNHVRNREAKNMEKLSSAVNSETIGWGGRSQAAAGVAETTTKVNETEKIWHYQDPAGKFQGPFSLVQLRKWNNSGYFPVDLRIWRTSEKQDDSMLLTDALAGKFFQKKEFPPAENNLPFPPPPPQTVHHAGKPYGSSLQDRKEVGHSGVRSQLEPSSSSCWPTPLVEAPPKRSVDRLGSNSSNLPSPTPMSTTPRWTGGQASESKQSSSSVGGVNPYPGGNGPIHMPVSISVNSGSREHTAMESLGMEPIRGSEPGSSNSLLIPNSTTALPASQAIVTGIHPSVETQQWGSIQTQEIGAAPHQNAGTETTHAWGGAVVQNSEPNPSLPAYGHWAGIPSSGNFSTPAFSSFPQPDPWGHPVVNNQSNIQPAAPTNVPWGMGGVPQNNVNTVWVPMPGNPQMGWMGPVPGATNMNWGAPIQETVNPGWVATTGNPGAMVQVIPPGNVNPNWVPQAGNPVPGNGNIGWVAPPGNAGFNIPGQHVHGNVNPVCGIQTGNPGTTTATVQRPSAPGNANPGWGSQIPGNSGMRGNERTHNRNTRFSGQKDNRGGRGWWNDRQSSFGSGGGGGRGGVSSQKPPNSVCPFYQLQGHCNKGSSCDMLHT